MKYFRAEEDSRASLPKDFISGFLEVSWLDFWGPIFPSSAAGLNADAVDIDTRGGIEGVDPLSLSTVYIHQLREPQRRKEEEKKHVFPSQTPLR